MRLFIHVGPHKTGTSALQASLHRNHAALRQRGAWYLGWERTTNHTLLGHAFLRSDPAASALLNRYIDAAAAAGCDTCIVSSESFSKHVFDPVPFLHAIKGLQATFVAYLRPPDDRFVSAFNQMVRHGRRVAPIEERGNYDPTYQSNLTKWAAADGHRLVLAPYDERQWPNGSILDDFLGMIGVDATGLDHTLEPVEANRSLPVGLTEVLRLANGLAMGEETRRSLSHGLEKLAFSRPELFANGSLLDRDARIALRRALRGSLDVWRPHFRAGFEEGFLISEDF